MVCYGIIQSLSRSLLTLADTGHYSRKSDLKKESRRGFVIDDSPATSETVSSLSRLSHSYRVLCTISCVLTVMLGAQHLGLNCSGLWSALKNRWKSGTETSNLATKAMFISASGQVRSTLSPRCIVVLSDCGIPLSETNNE